MALPLTRRLRKTRDLERVFAQSRRAEGELISLRVHKKEAETSRFAVIVSKKVSKRSTARNRLKRRVAEWLRTHINASLPIDAAVRLRPGAAESSRKGLQKELESLSKRLRIV